MNKRFLMILGAMMLWGTLGYAGAGSPPPPPLSPAEDYVQRVLDKRDPRLIEAVSKAAARKLTECESNNENRALVAEKDCNYYEDVFDLLSDPIS